MITPQPDINNRVTNTALGCVDNLVDKTSGKVSKKMRAANDQALAGPMKSPGMPRWVPDEVRNYLAHTEHGASIRALARAGGIHASTVLRQIRRIETQRDDPLVDAALRSLGALKTKSAGVNKTKDSGKMSDVQSPETADAPPDGNTLMMESVRILRRLCETGALLAVAAEMEKAVVVRDSTDGSSTRTAVVERSVAEAMALKGWIATNAAGRITRYHISTAGRSALADMMAKLESAKARQSAASGFAEAPATFDGPSGGLEESGEAGPKRRRMRYSLAESPLTALARRRDKNGDRFLSDDLVHAGERLREDFELAQMGTRVTQDWNSFLTGGTSGGRKEPYGSGPSSEARMRVETALTAMGPGLCDVLLRCCCYLEGLEIVEKKLGWSARSGKIVLRIALMALKRHYDDTMGPGGPMIG